MENIIYHYCGTEKAYNILKGKNIRLSDITRSNDRLEMNILVPDIFDKLVDLYMEHDGFGKSKFLYKGKDDLVAWKVFISEVKAKILNDINDGQVATYVICFSEKEDLLSQWRGYADSGKGVVLGFDFNLLNAYVKKNKEILQLKKILYISEEERRTIVSEKAKELLHIIYMILEAKSVGNIYYDSQKIFEENLLTNFYYNILQEINDTVCYKMIGFQEECEWRLYLNNPVNKKYENNELICMLGNDKTSNEKLNKYINDRLDFRVLDADIQSYISIDFDDVGSDVVKKIICGPDNFIRIADMELFLRKYGYDDYEIKKSSLSFRN